MISICIPVYNFDITSLVNELSKQANLLNTSYEIIVIDDCSDNMYKEINKKICAQENYIELEKNIGRSKIRNLFLKYSTYENLLFLDCDSLIISDDFIKKYIEFINNNQYSVVCGGRIYDKNWPGRDKVLRWKYGILKESQPFNVRKQFPNKSFMTNNFLIKRSIFNKIKFDERISEYGHEDTLFGYSLKEQNIAISHIDNPVLNGDLENNTTYLEKTKKGIINLVQILKYVNFDKEFVNDITILRFYNKIKKIEKIIRVTFIVFNPLIIWFLSRGFVNLKMFDFYKLGLFIKYQKK